MIKNQSSVTGDDRFQRVKECHLELPPRDLTMHSWALFERGAVGPFGTSDKYGSEDIVVELVDHRDQRLADRYLDLVYFALLIAIISAGRELNTAEVEGLEEDICKQLRLLGHGRFRLMLKRPLQRIEIFTYCLGGVSTYSGKRSEYPTFGPCATAVLHVLSRAW